MKILYLRFKNLNSLYGEWSIDFTTPEFVSDGLFVIAGPTGAGKSTILDAICLALYGRTPRLSAVNKSGNDIMSRRTGECFAEVTFDTGDGKYRCHWSQHRARRQADGKLADAKHELSDAESGQILESKKSKVTAAIIEKTRMEFANFTRVIMLAQGGFAAFLQAGAKERAPILEKITGKKIYSQISVQVHERNRQEKTKLEQLEAESSGIHVFSEAEEKQKKDDIAIHQTSENLLAAHHASLTEAIQWRRDIEDSQRSLEGMDLENSLLAEKKTAFQPEEEKLARALQAAELEVDYNALTTIRNQVKATQESIQVEQTHLPTKETALEICQEELHRRETNLQALRQEEKELNETIKKVRELDSTTRERERALKTVEIELNGLKADIQNTQQEKAATESAWRENTKSLAEVGFYLSTNNRDASLASDFKSIQNKLEQLQAEEKKLGEIEKTLIDAHEALKKAVDAHENRRQGHQDAQDMLAAVHNQASQKREALRVLLGDRKLNEIHDHREALKDRGRVLNDLLELLQTNDQTREELKAEEAAQKADTEVIAAVTAEIEKLESTRSKVEQEVGYLEIQKELLVRIKNLEVHRVHLEDGKPCPLCGSEEHPYAQGNIPPIDETRAKLDQAKTNLKQVEKNLGEAQRQKDRLEDGWKTRLSNIEKLQQSLIANEEKHTALLPSVGFDDSKAPNAADLEQALTETNAQLRELSALVKQVDAESEALTRMEEQEKECNAAYLSAEKRLQEAVFNRTGSEKELERIKERRQNALVELETLKGEVSEALFPYDAGVDSNPRETIATLEKRRDAWQDHQTRKTELEKEQVNLKTKLENYGRLLIKHQEDGEKKQAAYVEQGSQLEILKQERRGIFGENDPDAEESRLNASITKEEETLQNARNDRDQSRTILQDTKTRLNGLEAALGDYSRNQAKCEATFLTRLGETGFENEAHFLACRLSKEERDKLTRQAGALKDKQTELDTRRKDLTAKLAREREKQITEKPLDQLLDDQKHAASAREEILQIIGARKQEIQSNHEARERHQSKLEEIEKQKAEYKRWAKLHELIGSSDGDKYRNFAQGLTFELMVAHANKQLTKMTDRYLLVRDKEQPLELNVIDTYQAGEVRPTRNLSGGESFIVSLALALGLSHMAGQNVRVDSLFLDEGFGTLDEDALETALETLAGLQQDGKLIGIISHIAGLKERISTRIQVNPTSGGKSRLSGPGVVQI